jgi:Undecaprenyl-phosphate galactose phosphotransferase WbaP
MRAFTKLGVRNLWGCTDYKKTLSQYSNDKSVKYLTVVLNANLSQGFNLMNISSDMDWLVGASIYHPGYKNRIGMGTQANLSSLANLVLKRAMDIVLSILLGLVFLPITLLTALLVRLDSPGPIFFTQERVGKDGRKITIHKFRSMRVDADRVMAELLEKNPEARLEWEQKQKLCDDPRVTRVGKWIRKFSVDEIPQLFDILKGDMSLIGPRPILMEQKNIYGDGIRLYRSVRPGLTGLWQVTGRNRTSFSQRTLYDVYYVRHWSIWLDLYILLRTVWVVLTRDGAY